MASANLNSILQRAFPLIRTHGFTRTALSLAGASGSKNSTVNNAGTIEDVNTPEEPLSDRAIDSLFGQGDEARKTLINAWLEEGLHRMGEPIAYMSASDYEAASASSASVPIPDVRELLKKRLAYNEPVIGYLPEVYALLASPRFANPPLDVAPAFRHVSKVAERACRVSGDESLHLWWHARRGSLAMIYGAAELHQLASPETAPAFLDSLLDGSGKLKSAADEAALYSEYILKSWKGIFKSYGVL